jgi:hypothetical protein
VKKIRRARTSIIAALCALVVAGSAFAATPLQEQNETLFAQLQQVHQLSDEQMTALRGLFKRSGYIGQGNPAVTQHPATSEQCGTKLAAQGISYENERFAAICGDRYMAPLFDPAQQQPEEARSCIDQFEFPNIPCSYPVVWVRAREAAQICAVQGKRLCDAHEWEGACAGCLQEPGYRFDLAVDKAPAVGVAAMRAAHNRSYAPTKEWAYGSTYQKGICATGSAKTPGCDGGGWDKCGSNTYPTGMFPGCRSELGVYDLHGNAAEHMSLPLAPEQMASAGTELGHTEMKGSWFVFDQIYAHDDWCRWRAPYWHGSRVMATNSHHNYHLSFRCCKSLAAEQVAK